MSPELETQLYEKYPEIFDGFISGFEHGDGWYNILDALCASLSGPLRTARRNLEWLQKIGVGNPKWVDGDIITEKDIEQAKASVAQALNEIPRAVQVKEKYGTLRFYTDTANSNEYSVIDFAEMMSARTCEVCGKFGKVRGGPWIRTLCDEHAATE